MGVFGSRETPSSGSSLVFVDVALFLFGAGIRHSMEKATQLVHGTPREAASQRTLREWHVSRSEQD